MKSLVGTVVAGKYRLDRVLGKGGMGVVFEATNQAVGRRVALKRLWAGAGDDADLVARLQREARATAAIHSPHVVEVLDVVRDEHDEVWVVMELLEGESLAMRIGRLGTLSPPETVTFVSQLLEGLEAAHALRIVHRDLKPANVFLHRRGDGEVVVKLLDFGISKWTGETAGGPQTATGATLGTPSYMAPEQALASKNADERSDVYSVGALLYECLSGDPPYGHDSFPVILGRLMTQDPTDISDVISELPPALVDVVRRAMARDPSDRFPTAAAMRDALDGSIDMTAPRQMPSTRRRPGPSSPTAATEPAATPFAAESMRAAIDEPRQGPPLRLLAGGVGIGLVAAIGWVVWSGTSPGPAAPAPMAALPPIQLPERVAPQPAQAVVPALPVQPPVAPAPAARHLRVTIQPPEAHARVMVTLSSGVELSSAGSPAQFTLAEGDEALRVTARAPGFRERTRELASTDEQIEMALERMPTARRTHGPTIDDRNPLRH